MADNMTVNDAINTTSSTTNSLQELGASDEIFLPHMNEFPRGSLDSERLRTSEECPNAEKPVWELGPSRSSVSDSVADTPCNEGRPEEVPAPESCPEAGEGAGRRDGGSSLGVLECVSDLEGSINAEDHRVKEESRNFELNLASGISRNSANRISKDSRDADDNRVAKDSRDAKDNRVAETLKSPIYDARDDSAGGWAQRDEITYEKSHLQSVTDGERAAMGEDGGKGLGQREDLIVEGMHAEENDKEGISEMDAAAVWSVVEEEKIEEGLANPDKVNQNKTPLEKFSTSITEFIETPHKMEEMDVVEEGRTRLQDKHIVNLVDEEQTEMEVERPEVKDVRDHKDMEIIPEKQQTVDSSVEGSLSLREENKLVSDEMKKKNVALASGIDAAKEGAVLPREKDLLDETEKKNILVGPGLAVMAQTEFASFSGEPTHKMEMVVVEDVVHGRVNRKDNLDSEQEGHVTEDGKAEKENEDEKIYELEGSETQKASLAKDGEETREKMLMVDEAKGGDTREIFVAGDRTGKEETISVDEVQTTTFGISSAEQVSGANEKLKLDYKAERRQMQERFLVGVRAEKQEETLLVDDIADEEVTIKETLAPDRGGGIQTEFEESAEKERTEEDSAIADVEEEEIEMAEETEGPDEVEDAEEPDQSAVGKRKRGKSTKTSTGKGMRKKKVEEDVCFICFDGGNLVLCDRRGCPKAYHPSCVGRDEAFFQSKGKWNCGWHQCSKCMKNAHWMCLTCTFSSCKGCIKEAKFFRIRGNKGLCETCIGTVNSIERKDQEKQEDQMDDKNSWEYLFKDYWMDLKAQLSITSEDLAQATSPWKGHDGRSTKPEASYKRNSAIEDEGSGSESSPNAEQAISKRRKTRSQSKSGSKQGDSQSRPTKKAMGGDTVEWASIELLEIVMHMRNGDRSFLPRSEVHSLLLDYIKRYNLRDPRRKSQVICDARLQNLFGKAHVGHFEMLNLLDSHFLIKEDSQADDIQGSVVDVDANHLDLEENYNTKARKDKKRKLRKKGDSKGRQSNMNDYAAIDMHNINLIYLRRNLVEDLLDDPVTFHEKVVGSFLRLRIPGNSKQDLYRLVQVIGTSKEAEPYKVGKKSTDLLLEILNLNKTEVIAIDTISNQDFTEDECKRLRQSIKCGLINRLSVGDIQEKAIMLQEVRVKNWLEAEIMRLSHLRDRASDMGHRKELRECVEKLQLLQSPEERQRRIEEIPQIHTDPNMDPSYESEDEEEEDKERENYTRLRGGNNSRRGREPMSPRRGGYGLFDQWSVTRNVSVKGLVNKGSSAGMALNDIMNDNMWSLAKDKELLQRNLARDRDPQQMVNRERPRSVSFSDTVARAAHSSLISDSSSRVVPEVANTPLVTGAPESKPQITTSLFTGVTESKPQINESEKMWHYRDPSGKVQGPFSMMQLRKWNNTGYFPADLRIWRTSEKPEESILLTNALAGKFQRDPLPAVSSAKSQVLPYPSNLLLGSSGQAHLDINSTKPRVPPASVRVPKYTQDMINSATSLPSPTPNQTPSTARRRAFESRWSPTPAQQSAIGASNQQSIPSFSPSSVRVTGGMESSVLTHGSRLSSSGDIPVLSTSANPQMRPQAVASADAQKLQVNMSPFIQRSEMSLPTPGSGNLSNTQLQKLSQGNLNSRSNPIPTYGRTSSSTQDSQTVNAGNPFASQSQIACAPSDQWRSPVTSQPNVLAPASPNVPWGLSMNTSNTSHGTALRPGPENQNNGWGPMPENPSMRWGGPMLGGTNVNWASVGPVPGQVNTKPGWFGPNQMQGPGNSNAGWGMNGQLPPGPANAIPSWVPPGQMLQPMNGNPSWPPSSQGPALGNPSPGWAAPSGNQMFWPSQQNQIGDRFGGGTQSGNPGYGGGNSWNVPAQYGGGGDGGSLRPPCKSQRVCKFYQETGHCKKGAGCDYLHN